MEPGNIRSAALSWFKDNYEPVQEPILTSRFYTPQQSWSNSRVWFFQIPLDNLDPKKNRFLHLLCENHLAGPKFIYLKVPVSFLILNEKSLEVDAKQKMMRIYLSAEATDMFKEVRKGSKLDFGKYVQNL